MPDERIVHSRLQMIEPPWAAIEAMERLRPSRNNVPFVYRSLAAQVLNLLQATSQSNGSLRHLAKTRDGHLGRNAKNSQEAFDAVWFSNRRVLLVAGRLTCKNAPDWDDIECCLTSQLVLEMLKRRR